MEYKHLENPGSNIIPVVSICVVTYNHSKYIKQCLDSVLMQKTDFAFEIILGEDESTDGTKEICIEYAEKYPDVIRLFLRSRKDVIYINGHPTARYNFIENLKAAKGKYIAILDGDDYWTDPLKLQKQIDFLKHNPGCSMCFHNARLRAPNREHTFPDVKENTKFNLLDFLNSNRAFSASVIYKSSAIVPLPHWFAEIPLGDYTLHSLALLKGDAICLPDTMSVYRVHSGGIQSALRNSYLGEITIDKRYIVFFETLKRTLPPSYHELVNKKILERYRHINSLSILNRNPIQFIVNRFNLLFSDYRPAFWRLFFYKRI